MRRCMLFAAAAAPLMPTASCLMLLMSLTFILCHDCHAYATCRLMPYAIIDSCRYMNGMALPPLSPPLMLMAPLPYAAGYFDVFDAISLFCRYIAAADAACCHAFFSFMLLTLMVAPLLIFRRLRHCCRFRCHAMLRCCRCLRCAMLPLLLFGAMSPFDALMAPLLPYVFC